MAYLGLKAIVDSDREERRMYYALPPDACPYDGSPLDIGWVTVFGGSKIMFRHCPMGDYAWQGGPRLT